MKSTYGIKLLLLLSFVGVPVMGKESPPVSKSKNKLDGIVLAPEDDHWEIFENTKNGFEFEKPICFEVHGRGVSPEKSNFVSISPGKKCRLVSESLSVEFASPDGISIVDLKRALKNPQSISNKKIKVDGKDAVISARRYNNRYYDGVAWRIYTTCNSKNVYIEFGENLDGEGLKRVREGSHHLPPIIDRIVHSFKCHERESKETKIKQIHLAPEDDHWEVFKNTKNGFEFEKPVCFDVQGHGVPPEKSDYVSASPSKKCHSNYDIWRIGFSSPEDVFLVDLENVLKNPQSISNKKIKIDRKDAVISARISSTQYYDGVAWKIYTTCNSKNVYIKFGENLDAEGLRKVREGSHRLPPIIDRIVHSFKCHEREPKKTKIKQIHLAPEDDHWEVFKNTKNGFEFEKPVCFQARGFEGQPAEVANFGSLSPEEKCSKRSHLRPISFALPDGIPVKKLKLVLGDPTKLHNKKLTIDGRAAVLSAKRYNDGRTNGVVWNLWMACHSKNLDVSMGENVDMEGLKKIKTGSRTAPALFLRIIHSLKCF